ncbi:MAG TPA: hypothetical protein VJ461_03665, partial [Candidatus Nanoarchaeia archaeon]|nr:hypothetical protein [Candidatus Nanoarchaeia archaeon]
MKKEFNRLTGKFILVSIVLILLSIPIMAENDPGHDTLYIEELGDSELNGSLNITNNLTVDGGKIKQAGTLTLYSDGTMPETGNYISGTGSDLYIDSSGSLYLKWNIGGNQVYIGKAGAGAVALNVSGALYVQSGTATIAGVNICLENGTNCPGGGIGDISGVYGDNIYIYNGSASGEVTLLLNETKLNATISAKITAGSGNISGAGTSGTLAKFTA